MDYKSSEINKLDYRKENFSEMAKCNRTEAKFYDNEFSRKCRDEIKRINLIPDGKYVEFESILYSRVAKGKVIFIGESGVGKTSLGIHEIQALLSC